MHPRYELRTNYVQLTVTDMYTLGSFPYSVGQTIEKIFFGVVHVYVFRTRHIAKANIITLVYITGLSKCHMTWYIYVILTMELAALRSSLHFNNASAQ